VAKWHEAAAPAVNLFPGCLGAAMPGALVQGFLAAMAGADFCSS